MTRWLVPKYIYEAEAIERERYASFPSKDDLRFFEDAFFRGDRLYAPEVKATPERLSLGKRIGLTHLYELRGSLSPHQRPELAALGNTHYDWRFEPDRLIRQDAPTFVCAGAGSDISFELGLAERYPEGRVLVLDPSPEAVARYGEAALPANVSFVPIGLGGRDETVRFYRPELAGAGSLSMLALNPGERYFELPIRRVETVCRENDVDPRAIDLLKFDIEGAEHDVIADIVASGVRPAQIACEFDQPIPPWTVEASIRALIAAGYRPAAIWDANMLFVLDRD